MRRALLTTLLALTASLCAAGGAGAVVLDTAAFGQHSSVSYSQSASSAYAGVALVPSARGSIGQMVSALLNTGLPNVTGSGSCLDPALASDLWWAGSTHLLPPGSLCSHGGPVVHRSQTFDLAWDPFRRDWESTRNYVEQFLRDVADGSGTLSSPYAVAAQYTDAAGRAANDSLYGGGCIDYGAGGGSCRFGNATGGGPGHSYPASGCPVTGPDNFTAGPWGSMGYSPNDTCLTDAQIQSELRTMVGQEGLLGRTRAGFSPTLVLMTPPGVETCLDSNGLLCSANGWYAPPPPSVSTDTKNGNIPAGTYQVELTYATAGGETLAGAPSTVTTTGTTSTIKIASPQAPNGIVATGWYAYISSDDGAYARQQPAGSPASIGSDVTLSNVVFGAPPPPHVAFCSYHSRLNIGGMVVPYVVQPWTALTNCDEPDAPKIPDNPPPDVLARDIGIRLVSPLSQAHLAALVDPRLDGWFSMIGGEIDDNGCGPLANNLDSVLVGAGSYLLQREFNDGGLIKSDPNAYVCAPANILSPTFVVPSAVNHGDVVEFDGSKTASALVVPRAGYVWSFGDGTTGVGPSVVHTFAKGGNYSVTLTVTDRGGYVRSTSRTIHVLGAGSTSVPGWHPRLQLLPQSLRRTLRGGVMMVVFSNRAADGLVTLSISRDAARSVRLPAGRTPTVVIGRGTVTAIHDGLTRVSIRLARNVVAKLSRLRHVTILVNLALFTAGGAHTGVDAAGRY